MRSLGVAKPCRDIGHGGQGFRIAEGLHRPAVGVTADDDVADAEGHYRIFHRRGDPAIGLREGGHDIAGVATDEQIPRRGLGDEFRDHA